MPNRDKKRVLVADRVAIIRAGLRAVLPRDSGLTVVGEAADGESLLQAVAGLEPDGVLVDAALDGAPCLHLILEIKRLRPSVRVALFVGANQPPDRVIAGLRAGADGYIAKTAATSELTFAMVSILKGQTYLSPEIAGHVIDGHFDQGSRGATPSGGTKLSGREQDVLRLVAVGRTSKEIGDQLFISSRTVEKHRATLMRKLGVPHMAALLCYAFTNGFAQDGPSTQLLYKTPASMAASSAQAPLA